MRLTHARVRCGVSILLAATLSIGLAPLSAFAEGEDELYQETAAESYAFAQLPEAEATRKDEAYAGGDVLDEPAGAPEDEVVLPYEEGQMAALIPVGELQGLAAAPETMEGEQPLGSAANWTRIAGANALKTMQKVVRTHELFVTKGTNSVVIATDANYKDALAAAGIAGNLRGPILITNGKKLSAETKAEISHINPKYILIAGGTGVITKNVENQLKALRRSDGSKYTVGRAWGTNAALTSLAIYKSLDATDWGECAFICTGNNYKDALSIAPYAYWAGCPIFLCNTSKSLSKRVLDQRIVNAIASGGFEKVIIMGGAKAIPATVETQLKKAGLVINKDVWRCYGSDALGTSSYTAEWELSEGMDLSHMTVATTKSYKDALCSVAVAAECDSVMVLCNQDGGLSAFNKVYDSYEVKHGHVIGGTSAISASNYQSIINHA